MIERISALFGVRTEGFSNNSTQTDISVEVPETCPHCAQNIVPIILTALSPDYIGDVDREVGVLARCTSQKCKKYFTLQYKSRGSHTYEPVDLTYDPPIPLDIPENIEGLSPEFAVIYKQAAIAEQQKLDKIAGIGYRKAAEFLYKDFTIKKNPSEEETIKKMPLKQVIKKYMTEHPSIQSLSTTVVYIGNDETHYVRKHTDKDLQDLKRFLKSSIKLIDAVLDVDESLEFNA